MLLYHFPLNTQESIENFTNKGIKNDWYYKDNNRQTTAINGKISNICCLPNSSCIGLVLNSNTFTIAFRAYLSSSTKSWQTFLECRVGSTMVLQFLKHSEQYFHTHGIPDTRITTLDRWHDVVITANNGFYSVYYDGKFINSNTIDGIIGNVTLYGRYENDLKINIKNQDIRIYDYALSQAEINEYSRALVVQYPLQGNELNPSVLKDVSGFGNDYTLQGTNSYQLDSARGVKSLHTTDTAIYTQTPISSGYTTSFWCKYNGEWKHLCKNGSKYVNGVVETSLYDTIYATLTASGYGIVDYRVYATALSAEDIKNLYNSPISLDNKHNTTAFEFKENPLYPSKYWRTPTYAEMKYILYTRANASSLRTLGRVEVSSGTYVNGCFLLPDDWVLPDGLTMTITTANYTTNTYSLADFKKLEDNGAVFLANTGYRNSSNVYTINAGHYYLNNYRIYFNEGVLDLRSNTDRYIGRSIRLCRQSSQPHSFSTSATTKIKFAKSNLQYHCTQHKWRFAEHSYDYIGAANANISDNYNGWIDLFGYGTSGVNYSPTLHTTNNADYASGDIANTNNDWGINEIQSYDYNVASNKLCKTGVVCHNEIGESYEQIVYPSNTWRTPTYDELNYLLNMRTNASNLKTFIRLSTADISRRGMLLLPDDWVKPADANLVIVSDSSDDSENVMDMDNFKKLLEAGAVFMPRGYSREGNECETDYIYYTSTDYDSTSVYILDLYEGTLELGDNYKKYGFYVRLCRTNQGKHTFSASASHLISFAYSNLQYHCTEHKWRFAPNAYDRINKAENESISDNFNGWIDLFGYGTSGKVYAPTLISTNAADYAQGNLNGTQNDWGVNEIIDTRSVSRGLYKDKLILDNIRED